MDPESKKFGGGHFLFQFQTHYLRNVVGGIEIRKGDGMQLDQLIQNTLSSGTSSHMRPLDLDILKGAFQLKETAPIDLPDAEKGILTIAGKSKGGSKDREKKHKKHKDRGKNKDNKQKHSKKDRSKDKEKYKKKDKSRHHDSSADPSKKHHEKKRKHVGDDGLNDVHKHKKSKHKSSKTDELVAIKDAG